MLFRALERKHARHRSRVGVKLGLRRARTVPAETEPLRRIKVLNHVRPEAAVVAFVVIVQSSTGTRCRLCVVVVPLDTDYAHATPLAGPSVACACSVADMRPEAHLPRPELTVLASAKDSHRERRAAFDNKPLLGASPRLGGDKVGYCEADLEVLDLVTSTATLIFGWRGLSSKFVGLRRPFTGERIILERRTSRAWEVCLAGLV